MTRLQSVSSLSPQKNQAKRLPRPSLRSAMDLQMQLPAIFGGTLDVKEVIRRFFDETRRDLHLDGLCYRLEEGGEVVVLGENSSHCLDYALSMQEEALGGLTLYRKKRFGDNEISWVELALTHLVIPLKHALQYRAALALAMMDALTNVGNRRALEQAFIREYQAATRHSRCLSIMVIDLDHFKLINDSVGHAAGDKILRQVSTVLKNIIRLTDQIFRFGGEEFVVLLPDTDIPGARIVAERMRRAIDGTQHEFDGKTVSPTLSIGMATIRHSDSIELLMKRADTALYKAKSTGRNRVCTDIGLA